MLVNKKIIIITDVHGPSGYPYIIIIIMVA